MHYSTSSTIVKKNWLKVPGKLASFALADYDSVDNKNNIFNKIILTDILKENNVVKMSN